MEYVHLSEEAKRICGEHFELEKTSGKKAKGNCGKCPIQEQCLKEFTLKKMGSMNARNAALNEYVAGMDS